MARLAAVPLALLSLVLGLGLSGSAAADRSSYAVDLPDGAVSLLPPDAVPTDVTRDPDWRPVELGLRFSASVDGELTGLRYFRSDGDTGSHPGRLWDSSGEVLARLVFPARSAAGWQYEAFATPVDISAGVDYLASYHIRGGHAAETGYFDDQPYSRGPLATSSIGGDHGSVHAYGWQSKFPAQSTYRSTNYWIDPVFAAGPGNAPQRQPSPTSEPTPPPAPTSEPTPPPAPTLGPTPPAPTSEPTPPPAPTSEPTPPPAPEPPPAASSSGFPGPSNTGVPAGVSLASYTGPTRITQPGTVIDAQLIRGTLVIAAPNVTIIRSKVIGNIESSGGGSAIILDTEVDGGTSERPAVGYDNLTLTRVNVHGSRVSVLCGSNCQITDSWLHDQYLAPGSNWHLDGYVTNGGSNVVLRHNTIACEPQGNSNGGACTGPVGLFGDFAPLVNIVLDNNLFVATPGGFCLSAGYNPEKPFGSNPSGIVVTNNVFQRGPSGNCGYYGAVSFFLPGLGNVFSNNTFDDGIPVRL